jgi:ubiquinone biosynthesis monooxygenase Coq7
MTKPKYLPGDKNTNEILESMIRVNHAGEYGAKRIYQGQLSVLSKHKEIKEMLSQELVHLEYFTHAMQERKVRPTLLQPLWHIGGFMLGKATALLGERAAMACTVAVEEVIGEHYQNQLDTLQHHPKERDLAKKIAQFRDEELEHRDTGISHKAASTPGYTILTSIIKGITKTAIKLSQRI